MPGNEQGATPDGSDASVTQTETRRKKALENIKNGVSKKSAKQLLEENPPNPKLEREIAKAENKLKTKENKFPRNDVKDLEEFVEHCVKSLDMQLVMVPVSNKQIPKEWVLEHNQKRVAWICPRASMRFGVYLFLKGERQIIKVYTREDMDEVFGKIKARCDELAKEPEQKPKKSKNGKGRQSVIAKLELAEARAKSNKMSNGFSLGNIKVTPEVIDWVEKKGYTLQSRSIKW